MNFLGIYHPSSSFISLLKPVRSNAAETATNTEIRVCVNRICRRKGSNEILQVLTGIAPPDVAVNSCGCLGRCGIGPNVVVLPGAVFVSHCGTAARAAGLMSEICGGELGSWSKSLEALALRKRAEDEMGNSNFSQAEILLSQVYIHIYIERFCSFMQYLFDVFFSKQCKIFLITIYKDYNL